MYQFSEDARLGIRVPILFKEWVDIDRPTQELILMEWEKSRGRIPDRIKALETNIIEKLDQMADEEDFNVVCQLNNDIAELASIINDLWLWYRVNEKVSYKANL